MSEKIAVIDTETTWRDEVMSIGIAVADSADYALTDKRYYILLPYKDHGGMYTHTLYINGVKPDAECSRDKAMSSLAAFLAESGVNRIFAYNANFDYSHLPELQSFTWYDIMRLAAYRQYNRGIPRDADCFGTGRLKRNYGVESIYRMLSGDSAYCETHNALFDAADELAIMRMLGIDLNKYIPLKGEPITTGS